MHRMHANRVSNNGTSAALEDGAIERIKSGVEKAHLRRSSKKIAKNMTKTASVTDSKNDTVDNKVIKVSSIKEIPSSFERIGTGFFRQGHHLWSLETSDDGYILTRKRGEDHVLGYDPEPIVKQSNKKVTDRFGSVLTEGSIVKFPHHGKVAQGTVVVLSPGALGVDLGGQEIGVPPDMVEMVNDVEVHEGSPDDMDDPDNKEGGAEFSPGIEPSSKEAQTEPSQTLTMSPIAPADDPSFMPESSVILNKVDDAGAAGITIASSNQQFYIAKQGDNYNVYHIETKLDQVPNISTREDVIKWEANLEPFNITAMTKEAKLVITAALNSNNTVDMKVWKDYWRTVGQRVAQSMPKMPVSSPEKMPGSQTGLSSAQPRRQLTEEQKERRRQRRRERKMERAGLPPGAKPPAAPKTAVGGGNEIAEYKEMLRAYEQLVDEIEYILSDESMRENEVLLADEMERVINEHREEMEAKEDNNQEEMDNNLSLNNPSNMEMQEPRQASNKIVVSMSDL